MLDAFVFSACPNVASQEDAMGVCSPSSSVFPHLKVDAPAQDLVSVLAQLMILHMVANLNCSSPAASPSSLTFLPSLGCPSLHKAIAIHSVDNSESGLLFFGRTTVCA